MTGLAPAPYDSGAMSGRRGRAAGLHMRLGRPQHLGDNRHIDAALAHTAEGADFIGGMQVLAGGVLDRSPSAGGRRVGGRSHHVWVAPGLAGCRVSPHDTIECIHVSGLFSGRSSPGRYGIRGLGSKHHQTELEALHVTLISPQPRSVRSISYSLQLLPHFRGGPSGSFSLPEAAPLETLRPS